jgi:hypothetical protein
MDTNTDRPALARFVMDYVQDGVGEDGLPLYTERLMIWTGRPPLTWIPRLAEDDDFVNFEDEYKQFQKQQAARKHVDGYPLALWPVVSIADLETCAARDIYTVQQLAALKGDRMPPAIRELAERARAMVKLQGQTGKYEQIISDLTAERDQLAEQLKEANAQLSARDAMIDTLKMRVA